MNFSWLFSGQFSLFVDFTLVAYLNISYGRLVWNGYFSWDMKHAVSSKWLANPSWGHSHFPHEFQRSYEYLMQRQLSYEYLMQLSIIHCATFEWVTRALTIIGSQPSYIPSVKWPLLRNETALIMGCNFSSHTKRSMFWISSKIKFDPIWLSID